VNKPIFSFLIKNSALIVVGSTFLWSAVAILRARHEEAPAEGSVVLRLGHWQLEAGVRDGLNAMAEAYHKLHPNVTIIQDAVPEGTYGQWLSTQLMGGTAPDIMEVGLGVPYNVLLGYYNRYFLPMTSVVNQPNPYNKGTDLEGVPWRKTYKDGMRTCYIDELQEYMRITLSQFGIRVFYNKNLLKRLTGRETPPRNYREFLEVCRKIKGQVDERGKSYTPIAGSAYHLWMWDGFMADPLTYGALRHVDFNRDATVGNDELFVGFKTGRIDFQFPPYEAKFRMVRELTEQFQAGFTGLGRDEAVFLFAQQRAVFISTGTWDAGSLHEQARGVFEVGIMDFPIPAPDDPEYGKIAEGPVYERPEASFGFVVTRTCKHPEVAIDFLLFVGSKQGNEELNRMIGWIPAVSGTQVSPMLQPFSPHLQGIFGCMPITLGGETIIKWAQLYSLYQVNQISYPQLTAEFLPYYLDHGEAEWTELRRNRRRGAIRDEQLLAGIRDVAGTTPSDPSATRWIKYRQLTTNRLLYRDLNAAYLRKQLHTAGTTNGLAPYAFSPEVVAEVKKRLTRGHAEARPAPGAEIH
jgi:raffinose/stachyose/melibiose transport system substrate-binding protein